ncbi:Prp18 [Pseudocohnilembus persalinus]|uniref:Pre-mRNA-splicing factor 18 n=1 Tax=Pseudocohnilembus persalinus TaxID=266149 RepID=A0A0V0R3M0_PSEPJ|nr:Prp18 [Pseudocohnilembus persalinus]|eukprot:KRX09085.1 Prp18 [Pseudocohnilembus persalinus]
MSQKKQQTQGQTWVKKGELNQKQKDEYMQKQQELEQQRNQKKIEMLKEKSQLYKGEAGNLDDIYDQCVKKIKREKEIIEEQEQEQKEEEEEFLKEVPLPKNEVIEQLRELKQPVTYFGESDWKRYKRLINIKENKEDLQDEEINGQNNILKKEKKIVNTEYKPRMKKVVIDQTYIDKLMERKIEISKKDKKKNDEYVNTCIEDLEKQKCISNWINKVLKEWEEKLEQIYDTPEKRNCLQGKQAFGMFKQCLEYIYPLVQILKGARTLSDDILGALYQIAYQCMRKEYIKAHDKYLDVAIGNAPWPMGVTQVGIHERAGRSKIFSSQIAHVLNDENQRRYLSSVKRLITISQKLYPTEPSKMVNFMGEASLTF